MKRQSVFCHLMALVCAISLVASLMLVPSALAQSPARLGRPSSSDLQDLRDNSQDTNYNSNDTGVLPANAQYLPKGWVLIVELDSELKSSRSKVGDRFNGRVVVPVYDETGNVVIPINTTVDGHVSAVRPAQWRRRSGIIGIQFDSLVPPFGRPVPVRGELTSADAEERRRLEKEEDSFKGKEPIARHVLFIGGGATVGATLGWIGGSALLGGGAGAAAGLAATLLMKGKDITVPPRERFGLRLVQPLPINAFRNRSRADLRDRGSLSSSDPYGSNTSPTISTPITNNPITNNPPSTNIPPIRPAPTPTPRPRLNNNPTSRPTGTAVGSRSVPIYSAYAQRTSDGLLMVSTTAETPSSNWRIFTNHEVRAGAMDVRLYGVPTSSSGTNYTARPIAPMITVQDRNASIRRVVVYGSNGETVIEVQPQAGRYLGRNVGSFGNPGTSRPNTGVGIGTSRPAVQPTPRPAVTNPQPTPFPSNPTAPAGGGGNAQLSEIARRASNSLETVWRSYANVIGYELNLASGEIDRFIARQSPTQNQELLLDRIKALRESVRELRAELGNSSLRVTSSRRVQEDLDETERLWQIVPLPQELNRQWRYASEDIRVLINATAR